jgi:hypothetical protein
VKVASGEGQRGECEGEPFGVKLTEVIGERKGGACGCGKPSARSEPTGGVRRSENNSAGGGRGSDRRRVV